MTMRRVNHIGLDGSTVSITFGRHEVPCMSVSYADKLETEVLSHMGNQKIDERTRGVYKTEQAKVKMTAVVFRADFAPFLPKQGYGVQQIPIVVSYSHPDLGDDSDLLAESRFVGISLAAESAAKGLDVEFGIDFNQLYVGEDRKTINQLDTKVPIPTSRL